MGTSDPCPVPLHSPFHDGQGDGTSNVVSSDNAEATSRSPTLPHKVMIFKWFAESLFTTVHMHSLYTQQPKSEARF